MESGKKEQEKNSQKYFYKMELKTKVGLLQLKIHKNKDLNIKKAVNKIRYAAKKGAKIVCTSELLLFEYFCKTENHSNFKYAEKIPGAITDLFCKLTKELNIILIISLFEKKISGLYYNTCIIINDKGKIISKYRKCIFLTTQVITKNFILHQEILVLKIQKQDTAKLEH